ASLCLIPVGAGLVRNIEALVLGPAEVLLGLLHSLCAQRFAVNLAGAGLGAAVADDGADADERRTSGLGLGCGDSGLESNQVIPVVNHLNVPVVGLEAQRDIFGVAEFGRPVEGDEVVIIEDDQLAEVQRSGQRCRLVGDAFHQVAVSAKDIGVVV